MTPFVPRRLPPELEMLAALALDLRWTWSHAGDALWRAIDPQTWRLTGNPWFLLHDLPQPRLLDLAANPAFRAEVQRLAAERDAYLNAPTWFGSHGSRLAGERIAYFSMEFGLGEAIPLYAGGLGILAGDYLKTASDLGLPLVGVGILFREGYFRQAIDADGRQHEAYPYNDPIALPIQPVISSEGGWLRVPLELPGRTLWLRVWRANVGRVDLYLLDANEPINSPVDRGITAKLYGGPPETRLLQELVLGIGGWRALHALGIAPSIAHLNEGHTAFVVLERARQLMDKQSLSFRDALWATRAGNVFTTHTSVAAGLDRFSPELIAKYFPERGPYLRQLSIGLPELMALGRIAAGNSAEPFNMAYLAVRGSAQVNGVSQLHGAVSRRLFSPLYPRRPEREVPIGHITNGVHVPTWDSRSADVLWTQAGGKARWSGTVGQLQEGVAKLTDYELWAMRNAERAELILYARARLAEQLMRRGLEPSPESTVTPPLDPHALTIGFARRFVGYKRPNLLLREPNRLVHLLSNAERPVQLIIAGKAHPASEDDKHMIAEWISFVNRPDVRRRAVFLEDYDMAVAARLVQGVDVWINTPRRPWEACGTSGMKILANGGLNLSELDGWWAEAYSPELGWRLSRGGDGPADDARDADALYALLEREVVPEFYRRDRSGLPRQWLARVRASMAQLTPAFSSNRMVIEYVNRLYIGAAEGYRRRTHHRGAAARSLSAWEETLLAHFGDVQVSANEAIVRGDAIEFCVEANLGVLSTEMVRVELFAEALDQEPPFCEPMRERGRTTATGPHIYELTVSTSRSASDFTPRVVPYHQDAQLPAECPLIAWSPHGFAHAGRAEQIR
jgi:glycogen phosphorylase